MAQAERVVLGRAVGVHGLRGELRVHYFGDGPDNLARQPGVWMAEPSHENAGRRFTVVAARSGRPGELRLALAGIETPEAARELKGLLVVGSSDELLPLDADEFYWHELIGCRVETQEGREVGVVREIWATGAHDVLVVEQGGGGDVLISTAREIVTRIDPAAGLVVVDALPGLLEDPAS
ncbi:MAG: ribosome maturation factor RimM [Myxococcota bacterium]